MAPETDDIIIDISMEYDSPAVDVERLESLCRGVLKRFSIDKAHLGIAVVDDGRMVQVNQRFLDSSAVTDVISFDLSDEDEACRTFDLVVNAELAGRQGQKRGHSAEAELALYITHGLLHNLGFDDDDETGTRKMHEMEDEILQQAGFGIIYAERPGDAV